METLLELGYVTLSYESEKKCLVQTWKKFCTTEEYKLGQEKSLELVVAKGCTALICDTTNAGMLKADATQWAGEVLVPMLKKAGINNVEVVLPESAFTKMTLLNLEKQMTDFMRYYGSYESALAAL